MPSGYISTEKQGVFSGHGQDGYSGIGYVVALALGCVKRVHGSKGKDTAIHNFHNWVTNVLRGVLCLCFNGSL